MKTLAIPTFAAALVLAGCNLFAGFDTDDLPDEATKCTSGPCCDETVGRIADDQTICDTYSEYGCTGTLCGSDARIRTVNRFCDGASVDCEGDTEAGQWVNIPGGDCTMSQVCETDGTSYASCVTCELGCFESEGVAACYPECVPESGPCCDEDGTIAAFGTPCDTWSEYRCSDAACGADVQEQIYEQRCDGTSVDCAGGVVEGGWRTVDDCALGSVCDTDGETYAQCVPCPGGDCTDGRCDVAECTTGPCCNTVTGTYRLAVFRCSDVPEAAQTQCGGEGCGADVQSRVQYRHCTGDGPDCTTENLVWTEWSTSVDCGPGSVCVEDGSGANCSTCEFGCDASTGGCYPQCEPGQLCCDPDGTFSDPDLVCATTTEYRCGDPGCGGDVESRVAEQHCPGTSPLCEGEVTGSWSTAEDCTEDQICKLDTDGGTAFCYTCPQGCTNEGIVGACDAGCDPAQPCCSPDGHLMGSNAVCDEYTEFRCSGLTCGADLQRRDVVRYCSGTSAACEGTITGTWVVEEDCPPDALCVSGMSVESECVSCELGCGNVDGVGVCYNDCVPGHDAPCCAPDGTYRPSSHVCRTYSRSRCTSESCGGDIESQTMQQLCPGDGHRCTGTVVSTGSWTITEDCDLDEMCTCPTELTCSCVFSGPICAGSG